MDFPIEVFPPEIQSYLEELPAVTGCHLSYAGLSALFVASLIGTNSKVKVKEGFTVPLNLYCCIVAPKGSAKSIAHKKMLEPVKNYTGPLWTKFQKDLDAWLEEMEKASPKQKRELYKDKPIPPRTIYISGGTIEGIRSAMIENLMGGHKASIGLVRDELNGFFESMNQYKSNGGDEKEIYLQMYDGDDVNIRNKNEFIRIKGACLSVIGTIQNSIYKSAFMNNVDNGLLDRFIFSVSADKDRDVDPYAEFNSGVEKTYDKYMEGLIDADEGYEYELCAKCKDVGRDVKRYLTSVDDAYDTGASPKWWVQFHKFAGIMATVWQQDIDVKIMRRAEKLIKFFVSQFLEGSKHLNSHASDEISLKIIEMIKERGMVSSSEITRKFRNAQDSKIALEGLIDDGIVKCEEMKTNGRKKMVFMMEEI